MSLHVAVVGAGWAGLAAAIRLVDAGHRVTVLDAAPQAGGRARGLELDFAGMTVRVDNGQHLMIGAYRETLALMARIGVAERDVLVRTPMRLKSTDGLEIAVAPLPAPLHLAWALLAARGLRLADRVAVAVTMRTLARDGWRPPSGALTVAQWLAQSGQQASLVQRLWAPLCVAMLNTRIEEACAETFLTVLRDSLGAGRADVDFLLPTATLGDVLPEPACAWLAAHGAEIRLRTACRHLAKVGPQWALTLDGDATLQVDRVVLAVPAANVPRLFGDTLPASAAAPFLAFDHEPIVTVWLGWEGALRLPAATMLVDGPRAPAQWLFERGVQRSGTRTVSLAGAVVSAPRGELSLADLADAVARQVAAQLACRRPDHVRAVMDKRATFRCTPDRPRLGPGGLEGQGAQGSAAHGGSLQGVVLAGDYAYPAYPATLESAVRSGLAAADWIGRG